MQFAARQQDFLRTWALMDDLPEPFGPAKTNITGADPSFCASPD
jgi:hypothetical protein